MVKVNCGGFYINEDKLKIIKGALTKQDSVDVTNMEISGCGQLLIDADVFKFDNKTHSITMKEAESVVDTIFAPCGDLKLDTAYFEIDENNRITLKEVTEPVMLNSIEIESTNPTTKVTFESLEDFNVVVKNSNGEIVEPVEDKIYNLERTKTYSYVATNINDEISEGQITTTSRQANLTKTIEF